jgi:hypothetical protein
MSLLKPLNPRFNRQYPLAPGCVAYWPFAETSGVAVDIVGGVRLAPQTSAKRASAPTGVGGECVGSQVGFGVATPTALQLALPITIGVLLRMTGSPSIFHTLFGVSHNSTDADPYFGYAIGLNGSSLLQCGSNSSGVSWNAVTGTNVSTLLGRQSVLVATFTTTRQELWLNGASLASSTTARTNPTYGSGTTLGAGYYPGVSRTAASIVQCGGIWNRALTDTEVKLFSSDPFGVCRPAPVRRRSYSIPASSAYHAPRRRIFGRRALLPR